MAVVIVPAQTALANSSQFYNSKDSRRTLSANGLAGAEKVQLQYQHDNTPTWISMGSAYQCTATSPTLTISGEGNYRAVKDATVGAASVTISS